MVAWWASEKAGRRGFYGVGRKVERWVALVAASRVE